MKKLERLQGVALKHQSKGENMNFLLGNNPAKGMVNTGEQQRNIHKFHIELMKRDEEYEVNRRNAKIHKARINRSRRVNDNRIV